MSILVWSKIRDNASPGQHPCLSDKDFGQFDFPFSSHIPSLDSQAPPTPSFLVFFNTFFFSRTGRCDARLIDPPPPREILGLRCFFLLWIPDILFLLPTHPVSTPPYPVVLS